MTEKGIRQTQSNQIGWAFIVFSEVLLINFPDTQSKDVVSIKSSFQ